MSDLRWVADGIERALAVGGVELEVYRRPGFTAGLGVRRSGVGYGGSGFPIEPDSESQDADEAVRLINVVSHGGSSDE